MTTAIANLREVLAGTIPANGSLLQTCRFEGFGAIAYAPEPIADLLRRAALRWSNDAHVVSSHTCIAIVESPFEAECNAVFADVSATQAVARLWCLSALRLELHSEPELSVPSDLDLSQIQGAVEFEPQDHPGLAAHDAPCVRQLGQSIALGNVAPLTQDATRGGAPLMILRIRAIVIRAFSSDGVGAVLFRVQALTSADRRRVLTFHVGAVFRAALGTLIHHQFAVDRAGLERSLQTPWRPRI